MQKVDIIDVKVSWSHLHDVTGNALHAAVPGAHVCSRTTLRKFLKHSVLDMERSYNASATYDARI